MGRTRVHLDGVSGLGNFLELETVPEEHDSVEAGMREARELMAQLFVKSSELIEGAYVDPLA